LDNARLPKISRGKKSAVLKSQISDPKINYRGKFVLDEAFENASHTHTNPCDDSVLSPIAIDFAPNLATQDDWVDKNSFGLAPARLSPMEYARMYLINKSKNERENRGPDLLAPEKTWYWTPGWEKFLIVPKIPEAVKRQQCPKEQTVLIAEDTPTSIRIPRLWAAAATESLRRKSAAPAYGPDHPSAREGSSHSQAATLSRHIAWADTATVDKPPTEDASQPSEDCPDRRHLPPNILIGAYREPLQEMRDGVESPVQHHSTPVPDSPTLGYVDGMPSLPSDSRDKQSFSLLKSYMRSKGGRTDESDDNSIPSTDNYQPRWKQHGSENRRGHWYSSSFALNKAKSHDTFTLFPRLSPTTHRGESIGSAPGFNTILPEYQPQKLVKRRSISDQSPALALQNFDTVTRLASAINPRDSFLSTAPASMQPPDVSDSYPATDKASKFSTLFSRHARSESIVSQVADAQVSFETMLSSEVSTARQPCMPGTQAPHLKGKKDPWDSRSSPRNKGFSGLRDKLRFNTPGVS
jgi:hypothetical protein